MRFLIDAQLPPALVQWIEARGHECEHVADVQLLDASDDAIWEFARDRGAVLITKDADFAIRRAMTQGGPPPVVWLRFPNLRTPWLLARMVEPFPRILALLERGDLLIEVR